jgi:dephospho-CoA kinase
MSTFIVGLTGGIGSGKTTVSDMFVELNIDIVDADIVAREVVGPGSSALTAIREYFGSEYITAQQQLDRHKLRSRIFSNTEDKLWLNNLLHPLIRQEMLAQLAAAQSNYCILVAPLLLENGLNKLVNKVLVVDVKESCQLERTVARDSSSSTEVKRIIASQMNRKERLSFADDIIDNQESNKEAVRQQVYNLHQKYLNLTNE